MNEIRGLIESDLLIEGDTVLRGMVDGDIEVVGPILLELRGMINGNVLIKPESTVNLHGLVNGDVLNNGGILNIYGTINGRLFREMGETVIDADAIVREK